MTGDRDDVEGTDAGVPDSDPDHIDPAGDLADLFEDGALAGATVADDADREELEEWLARAEAGERVRGAWWRRVVKPGLKSLPDIEAPAAGGERMA
jgi:hypothetical protein